MKDHYHAATTLISRQAFVWCRHTDGSITVRDKLEGAVRARFNAEQYSAVLDLLTSRSEGICLDAVTTGKPVPDHLGWLLSSFAIPRSHASWIGAVAAAEGFVEAEQRGSGSRGLWLMPATDSGNRRFAASSASVEGSETRGMSRVDDVENQVLLNVDVSAVAANLRVLADQVERTCAIDTFRCELRLEHVGDEEKTALVNKQFTDWERELRDARYLYSFTVADDALALRCRAALAQARTRNIDNRRFSRVNGELDGSCCLYVGGSRSLASRIRQHLGLAHRATYAMQIAHWLPEQPLEGSVCIEAMRFPSDTDASVLQVLEDNMWLAKRPLFGRMGAR